MRVRNPDAASVPADCSVPREVVAPSGAVVSGPWNAPGGSSGASTGQPVTDAVTDASELTRPPVLVGNAGAARLVSGAAYGLGTNGEGTLPADGRLGHSEHHETSTHRSVAVPSAPFLAMLARMAVRRAHVRARFRVIDARGVPKDVADFDPHQFRMFERALVVDAVCNAVWRHGRKVVDLSLNQTLRHVFVLFASAPHVVISNRAISNALPDGPRERRRHRWAARTYIARMRRLLSDTDSRFVHRSQRGEGYRFIPPDDFLCVLRLGEGDR